MGRFGAIWGVGGVCVLLLYAIVRLSGFAAEAFSLPFSWWHWTLLIANVLFMAHGEGYKGFQRAYAPRVVARARVLLESPSLLRVALAPLFCMCFFDTTRRRLRVTYGLSASIVILILVFQQLDQPLRGILDAGVVVGLSWGVLSIAVFSIRAFSGGPFDYSPELAEPR